MEQPRNRAVLAGLATAAILLLACREGAARDLSPRFANVECANFVWMPERFDYRSGAKHDQTRIRQIEAITSTEIPNFWCGE